MTLIIINTDGGSRGNPGPAGIGAVICMPEGNVEKYNKYIGKATNNEAEYQAVIFALSTLQKNIGDQSHEVNVEVRVDSELLYKQMIGLYRVKHPNIRPLYDHVSKLTTVFKQVTFQHVRREYNTEADKLVNEILDKQ